MPAPYPEPAPVPPTYVEGEKPPSGYHVEKRFRRGLIISGSIVLGVMYSISMLVASTQDTEHSPSGWLYFPIAGPWIALGKLGSYDKVACDRQATSSSACPTKDGARSGYTMLGLGQLTGFLLLTSGILFQSTQLVPDSMARNGITVVPLYAGNTPAGLAVAGRF